MGETRVGQGAFPCELTVAVGSTALGETFCTIVLSNARVWPWATGVNLRPGASAAFVFEADGPMFGSGVTHLDWVELVASDQPSSLLWVKAPEPQQPDAATQVCADSFVLTVNEGWTESEPDECWLKLPDEVGGPAAAPSIVSEHAELLVSTNLMGRAWMQVPVSNGRGTLRDVPPRLVGSRGRYRWRRRVRDVMPFWLWELLGWPGGASRDCGRHEWFNHDDIEDHCYHCNVGRRPHIR